MECPELNTQVKLMRLWGRDLNRSYGFISIQTLAIKHHV